MQENEIITLSVDVSQAEKDVANITKDLALLRKVIEDIGTSFTKAFDSLAVGLKKTEAGLNAMSESLAVTTKTINQFMQELSAGDSLGMLSAATDEIAGLEDLLGAAFEGAASALAGAATTALIPVLVKAVTDLGEFLTIGTGGAAALVAAIMAVIAAIVMLVLNWDTCSAVVSQGFSDFCSGAEMLWASLRENVFNPIGEYVNAWSNDLWNKHLKPLWDSISALVNSVGESIISLWKTIIEPLLSWVVAVFAPLVVAAVDVILGAVSVVVGFISDIINSVVQMLDGLIQFVTGVFTGNWEHAWQGVVKVFEGVIELLGGIVKGVINVVILAINFLVGAIYSAIAGIINAIGGVSGLVGDLIGVDWHFSVPTNPPQIPYLAQGAVLPANKPFLAVVGDQRHGTNVEAPLATIQEAVALVMDDHIAAMMAGFEALLAEQRATRQTIESIEIGDTVIGKAVERYRGKMAVVRGGAY